MCTPCLHKLLQLAMQVLYAGALPRTRCPVCLISVNRQQLTRFFRPDAATTEYLLQQYRELCEASCSFTCPGYHNAQYTQLSEFYEDSCPDLANAVALTLLPHEKARIPEFDE